MMCYIFIHMDHLLHMVYSKVMISFGNPSILSDFFATFLAEMFICRLKGVLIAWFCVLITKIGKFQQNR